MRPAARLKTVSDLLPIILESSMAADRLVLDWGRRNRFAGSGDRRDIADQVFAILRHYLKICALVGSTDPAMVALGARLVVHGDALEDVCALADGSPHALAELDETARDKLAHVDARYGALEPHEQAAVPAWLYRDIMASELTDAAAVLDALTQRAPLDLRVNTLRGSYEQTRQKLSDEGIRTRALPKVPLALRVEGARQISGSAVFKSGRVDVQDAGAQIAAALCEAAPGHTVLDFCAGAGGKTLALAAQMQNKGRLFAYDAEPKRLQPMQDRLKRAGVGIVQIVEADALSGLKERCHLVVADVPCSGSGRWRRAPETKWHLTPDALDNLVTAQGDILAASAGHVKVGGRLAYITCSVIGRENMDQIQAFLQAHPNFEIDENATYGGQKGVVQLDPHNTDTDGLFCAIMRRNSP